MGGPMKSIASTVKQMQISNFHARRQRASTPHTVVLQYFLYARTKGHYDTTGRYMEITRRIIRRKKNK